MKEYLKNVEEVIQEQETSRDLGLSIKEVEKRQVTFGKNKLKEGKKTPLILRFLGELKDPMVLVLIAAAIVSLITSIISHESPADVIIIMVVVLVNAILGVYQESKAEKAIEALQEMSKATTRVIRDGHVLITNSEDIVPGDVILLEAGDAVPSDARIIECASLKVEEAALTGESVPVLKQEEKIEIENDKEPLLGDRKNMLYMGSNVVYGRAKAVVISTGMDTEMGKIADALSKAKDGETPLQKKLNQLSKILTILVLIICVVIFVVDLLRNGLNGGITGETILNTFMIAISLAVAAIPEGLAAVVTIVLSIGVTKMSRRNATIRKLTAVETLGCTQVICSDKTGTLTQNKMTVVEHHGEDEKLLAEAMSLCSDAELEEGGAVGEPTECALVNYAFTLGLNKNDEKEKYKRMGEAPFDSMRKMMSTVHRFEDGYVQFTKGAPDEVLKLCTSYWDGKEIVPLDEEKRNEILNRNKEMASKALRVLCAAMRKVDTLPTSFEAKDLEHDLCYIGLTGMIDPIRPEVKAAIQECKEAGIRVVMITGDHRDTAVAIATQLGILANEKQAITGAELNDMSDEELTLHIQEYSVYARVQPEHKVRIVQAWQKVGKITAMTGDGVNDAPSIKNADIGIGMGITGTDVTKNVADMVLADDNFATIVSAVEEGRRVYDNIRKAIQFLLSSNLAEVLSIFVASMLGFTVLKAPHLLWINLITDCFPAIGLGMEDSEPDSMKRNPRDSKEGIFAGQMGTDVLIQGVLITLLTLAAYFIGHVIEGGSWSDLNSADGITMAFLTLSLVEIFHSFNMRSRRKSVFTLKHQNKFLWLSMIGALILTTLVIYVPFLRDAFGFEYIDLGEYAIALGLAISIIPIMEFIKWIQRCMEKKKTNKK